MNLPECGVSTATRRGSGPRSGGGRGRADMHIHTLYSDGTASVAQVLEHVEHRTDLDVVAITDHERIDGAGYPQQLAGGAIPLEARILAVADAYEAMTADRPYRRALPVAAAREELRKGAGTQFDHDVVAAFERVLDRAEPGFVATLDATAPAAERGGRVAAS